MNILIRNWLTVSRSLAVAIPLLLTFPAQAENQPLLITNALVFDGRSETLKKGYDVLVVGDRIVTISKSPDLPPDTLVIDAAGRTMTPGFIDAHAHVMLQLSYIQGIASDRFFWAYVASQTAETYLMNGFTTIRDMSGNSFSLKTAIDRGILDGPRIYPSGPMISQTSGHSDHRFASHASKLIEDEPSVFMKYEMVAVADGRTEVLRASREALRRGATQIKIATGGGTGSYSDPMDVTQFTSDEIRAAVDAASDWGTYVAAHAYTDKAIRRAVDAGVKSIEHGNLASEDTLRYMQKNDVWLSPQVLTYTVHPRGYNEDQKRKHDLALAGLDGLFKAVKSSGFENIAFGTDVITDPAMIARVNEEFTLRERWFTPIEILRQATSKSAELLALSGQRNPYAAPIGIIEEGALADLLLIDGNPLEDMSLLAHPAESIDLIMKGGRIYRDETTDHQRSQP
jgi:imidazolonepropionase-like amidohydrolase